MIYIIDSDSYKTYLYGYFGLGITTIGGCLTQVDKPTMDEERWTMDDGDRIKWVFVRCAEIIQADLKQIECDRR